MTHRTIGGFFEEETALSSNINSEYHSSQIKLDSGRNALKIFLLNEKVNCIYMPLFICDTIFQPFADLKIEFKYYQVDQELKILNPIELKENEYLLYVNYFGLMDEYVNSLKEVYHRQLIVDNCQAFFSKPLKGVTSFYSARKFFGVSDGSYLFTPEELSLHIEDYDRHEAHTSHLRKRMQYGPEVGYDDFKQNEDRFNNAPIKTISEYSLEILSKLNYEEIITKRNLNFNYLRFHLDNYNKLDISKTVRGVPMCYPLWTSRGHALREHLIEKKVFIPKYWPDIEQNLTKDFLEYDLTTNLVALPTDHRYTQEDMNHVISIIENFFIGS